MLPEVLHGRHFIASEIVSWVYTPQDHIQILYIVYYSPHFIPTKTGIIHSNRF